MIGQSDKFRVNPKFTDRMRRIRVGRSLLLGVAQAARSNGGKGEAASRIRPARCRACRPAERSRQCRRNPHAYALWSDARPALLRPGMPSQPHPSRCAQVPLPPVDDRRKVQEDVDKDRKHAIEAAIVRIMKSRKALKHQQVSATWGVHALAILKERRPAGSQASGAMRTALPPRHEPRRLAVNRMHLPLSPFGCLCLRLKSV